VGPGCVLYNSVDCEEDRKRLYDWETQINETIPPEWDIQDSSPLCFQWADPLYYSIRFKHPDCRITRSQTSTYIMDYDLLRMRWDTLTIYAPEKWVDRTQGHYGIRSVLKSMVCSDVVESTTGNHHEISETSVDQQ
jgi:hypothetical protein